MAEVRDEVRAADATPPVPTIEPLSFPAHVELLEFFLARRDAVVEKLQELLNAQYKPPRYLQDRRQLTRDFEECFFTLPDLGADRARLKGQLEAAHWARGFKPRDMGEMPNDLLQPAGLMERAFVMWAHTRWPSRKARVRHAHILFNVYLVRQLALLAMRTWDAGAGGTAARLAQAQRVLDAVWRGASADQPVLVRDVRWLIPVAMSPTTDDLAPYFEVAEEIGANFADDDRLTILSATVRIAGGHLRSYLQYYVVQKGQPLGDSGLVLLTRRSNALDFSLLIHGLVALLDAYERAVESGEREKRLQFADAICQGVSPDPELFINRVDLLAAYTMVEHLFTTTDDDGHAAYTPLGRRHVRLLEEYKARIGRLAKPLYDDCRSFRPAEGAYSPYGVLYGVASNIVEHIAFKALHRDDVVPFGLEDVFVAGGADKLAWVTGWRKLPHIDRRLQRLYAFPFALAEALFARVEQALRTRATDEEGIGAARSGRLHVVAADDAEAASNAAAIPDLPVRYIGSSDIRVVAAGKAKAWDKKQIADARMEGHVAVSYETPGGWVAVTKDFLSEVLGAGRDAKVVGLPGTAAERLRLMCGVLVVR
ncbi:MAG TPA: hypothetical protein VHH11_02570 [Gammaproteobacteria bacterium]|jgi:hypothetical protein|nr:hypothetical protein [Gammaproteobacteria bacterium]